MKEIFLNERILIEVLKVNLEWNCTIRSETCPSPCSAVMTSGLHKDTNEVMSESE